MTETQKRIKAYKEALPGLRERVVAVALLLAMSVAMMTSASFAWLTISRSPEVTGVNTNIAANGNLEIALATGDGKTPPGESKVGDSSAAEGQSVPMANITWGNLINLSDPSYGLDHLALRPAQLNTAALLSSPLYGAVYGQDGRITQLSSDFGYASWNEPTEEKPGYFGVSEQLGVRAISSMKVEAVGAEAKYHNMVKTAKDKNLAAATTYANMAKNETYMQSLADMMGLFMTANLNSGDAELGNPSVDAEDIQNLRDMYALFLEAFDAEADAIASLANLSLFLMHGEGNYTEFSQDTIYSATDAELRAAGITVSAWSQFIKDRKTIASDLEKLTNIASSGTSLKWKDSGISAVVNNLVNVGQCTIGADNTPIGSIGTADALSYLSGTQEARITNGILYRFEERTGGYIEVKGMSITAKKKLGSFAVPASVKANIKTTASRDYTLFNNDLMAAQELNTGNYKGGTMIAQDTYGLAVDFWVRTNAEGSFLTLEGNVLSETKMVPAFGKDASGNEVKIFTATVKGEGEGLLDGSYSIDVYKAHGSYVDAEGQTVEGDFWHSLETHTIILEEELSGEPNEKLEEEVTILGYEGENRVWTENEELSVNATTQGSGSCYVYYADTPEDQARSLKLLEAFNVAFVASDGSLLAEAVMDTAHYYAASGRVIVPLIMSPSNSINLGENFEGVTTYAITPLEKNVATRITAIVYLDGAKLTNQEVLAAADIQGQLNIQFGGTTDLDALTNEELENKIRIVSATADTVMFDYDTATGPMTTTVKVRVEGDEPSAVTAFFLRSVNASQGSREELMTFTRTENGDWVTTFEFKVPGKYVLRTVQLDGIDYNLASPVEIEVKGFAIESLSCDEASGNYMNVMTAASTTTANVRLKFTADNVEKLPKKVQGRFLKKDGTAANIDFTYNATSQLWTGTATFLVSGEYTLQYLILDGQYTELDPAFWQTANVILGMQVAVYTTSPHKFKYVPSEMAENEKLLAMQVMVMDNTGNKMPGLSDVKLTYSMKGSGTKKMDVDLVWNGNWYVGSMPNGGPGVWQFAHVTVGNNVLTTATTSPTFTIQSPEPPAYVGQSTVPYQYSPDNKATMNVKMSNASTTTVQVTMVDGSGKSYTVVNDIETGSRTTFEDGTTEFRFPVPKNANGYQDGHWTITELRLWDGFAADGTEYTEEAPLVIDLSDTNNKTKVVARIYLDFTADQVKDFGKNEAGQVVGDFMDSYTISGLNVVIRDFEGPLKGIGNVKIEYVYAGDSAAKGGYSGGNVPSGGVTVFTINMKQDASDPTKFVQEGTQAVQIAGTYNPKISFTFAGGNVTYEGASLPAIAPVVTVNSVAPAVKITEASYASASSQTAATFTDTSTTVYAHQYETTSTVCGQTFRYKAYHQPFVTITLSGYGNATGATLTFTSTGGTVLLYEKEEGASAVSTYTWSGNGTCKRWVGYWNSQTGDDDRTTAGTLTATTLIIAYNGVEYTVAAPITINNPN